MAFGASYLKKYSNTLKRELETTTAKKARKFLLEKGYSCSAFKLPEYYKANNFENINLDLIDFNTLPPKITKTLDVLTPKNSLSWRSFNFLHPYIFLHSVNEITSTKNWNKIREILCAKTNVYSYSVPFFSLREKETHDGKAIINWLQMSERDIVKDASDFSFLTVTDIKNFYPSIYTHSIAWAVHGKKRMKVSKNRRNYGLLGNRLDKLFQNSRDGQTNGISVSSMVSDIVAEIILSDVDKKISKKIEEQGLKNKVLITRFRDDYRILSKNVEDGKTVLNILNKTLFEEYDLSLNSDKTETHMDIIDGTYRPWTLEIKGSHMMRKMSKGDFSECRDSSDLKDCLIQIYKIQRKYNNGRVSITILSHLTNELFNGTHKIKFYHFDIPEIISLLRKLSLLREDVTPHVFMLLDIILRQIGNKSEKTKILNNIKRVISGRSDQEYQLIWFYRICLSHVPKLCPILLKRNNFPLLRVVDRNYYLHDTDIFKKADISRNDKKELKKFSFIDRNLLARSKGTSMNPKYINPFKYPE